MHRRGPSREKEEKEALVEKKPPVHRETLVMENPHIDEVERKRRSQETWTKIVIFAWLFFLTLGIAINTMSEIILLKNEIRILTAFRVCESFECAHARLNYTNLY